MGIDKYKPMTTLKRGTLPPPFAYSFHFFGYEVKVKVVSWQVTADTLLLGTFGKKLWFSLVFDKVG